MIIKCYTGEDKNEIFVPYNQISFFRIKEKEEVFLVWFSHLSDSICYLYEEFATRKQAENWIMSLEG